MTARRIDREGLALLAQKYIWWKSPDDALDQPERVIAQVTSEISTIFSVSKLWRETTC